MPAPRIWLLTASPRNAATGAVVTVRLAGGGTRGFTQFGSTDWKAGLARPPVIAQRLGFDDAAYGDGSVVQALQIEWGGRDSAAKAMAALYWRDTPFTLHSGPDGGSDAEMVLILAGRMAEVTTSAGKLIMAMADPAVDLNKPVVTATFGGTGGIEGDVELKGQPKWRAWGARYNVSFRSLNKANNIHVCTDPAFPIQAFDQIYDRGNVATAPVLVAWAGSIAATLAALIAAVPPAGGAAIAPSISCIKWWFANPGKLTCDLRGEIGAGYVDRPADIAARIIAIAAGPTVNPAMLTAARIARDHAAGYLITDTSATIGAEISALLSGVSLWWALSAAGVVEIGPWEFGAPVATFTSARIDRIQTFKPVSKVSVGWRRNESVMSRGDIAGVVLYADGVALDALRPAEAAANVTGGHISAGIANQGPGATAAASAVLNSYIGPGQNLIPNSDQTLGSMFAMRFNPDNLNLPWGPSPSLVVPGFQGWTVNDFVLAGDVRSVAVYQAGRVDPLPNGYGFADFDVIGGTGSRFRTPCGPGEVMIASAYFSTHRCAAHLLITFEDAAGVVIDYLQADLPASTEPFVTRLSSMTRLFVKRTAPAGSYSASIVVGKSNTSLNQTSSYWWCAAPMLERASVDQQGPSPYMPGPPNTTRQLGYTGHLNADVTAQNIAAAVAGQGVLATQSAVTWNSQVSGRPLELTDGRLVAAIDAAGDLARNVTLARANSSNIMRRISGGLFVGELDSDATTFVVGAAQVTIEADANGTAIAGLLPKVVAYKLLKNATDLTASATWSRTLMSGSAASTIAGGALSISNLVSDEAVIRVIAAIDLSIRVLDIKLVKSIAPAAPPSGGGTSTSVSVFSNVTSTAQTAITADINIIVGPSGTANLTAPLEFYANASLGSFGIRLQWQRWNGAAWTDVGAMASENSQALSYNEGNGVISEPGYVSCAASVTGLSGSQKFRLTGYNPSGSVARSFVGTVTGTGN